MPGYSFTSELPWKIDHSGANKAEDQCWCCPVAVAAGRPDVSLLVADALVIKKKGLAEFAGEALGDVDAWYVGAYDLVDEAAERTQTEAELLSAQLHETAVRTEAARRAARGLTG